jgi:hypothetical protein
LWGFPQLCVRTTPDSKRPRLSAFSVAAAVLTEAGLSRGGAEAIRKIWQASGPPRFQYSSIWPPQK